MMEVIAAGLVILWLSNKAFGDTQKTGDITGGCCGCTMLLVAAVAFAALLFL